MFSSFKTRGFSKIFPRLYYIFVVERQKRSPVSSVVVNFKVAKKSFKAVCPKIIKLI